MSLTSLLAAGVERSARGYLANLYRTRVRPLLPAALDRIAAKIAQRMQRVTSGDNILIRRIVGEQDAAVRAAMRVQRGGRMTLQGTPITAGASLEAEGKPRFRITTISELADSAGNIRKEINTVSTDELRTLREIADRIKTDLVERAPYGPPPPPGVVGGAETLQYFGILAIERRY